ncbi:MAG: sigma-70 family RNA polymerase sigma factor [Bryobacteraceae bacterium]|nr:sigma-70 family RNA polymerase sigma factor [Bryobacteraceae bacterium]
MSARFSESGTGPAEGTHAGDGADREALDHLFSSTYEELKRMAAMVRRRDRAATVSATTLVNEAWIKLARRPEVALTTELHFKRIAARAMRQVLVSAARRRQAAKRDGGPGGLVTLDESAGGWISRDEELLALDEALSELFKMNPRQAQMVESRFFGGLETTEIAELLGVSEATVLRDWRAARAWLIGQLRQTGAEGGAAGG